MEARNVNTNIDNLLVPSGNVQLENSTTAESGLIKTRVRYSGAARRRYRKMKLRGKLPRKAQIPPAIVSVAVNMEQCTISAVNRHKRVMPEHSPPNSPDNQLDKKPKVTDQGWRSFQTTITKLAFVPEGYPNKKLKADDVGTIRKLINKCILDLPENAPLVPTFTGTWERDGAIIFDCANEPSADWLKNLSTQIKIDYTPLHVLPADELPERHWIVVHVDEPELTSEAFIELLDKQNAGLIAKDWIIVKGSKSVHFPALIGNSSLEALKACGFKPFCGLGRAAVKFSGKERGEGTEETTTRGEETV